MKRAVIPVLLLIALTWGGFSVSRALSDTTDTLLAQLSQAEVLAEQGDWVGAEDITRQALSLWEQSSAGFYLVLRNDSTTEISVGFQEVLSRIDSRELGEYRCACRVLAARLTCLAASESPTPQNLL